MSQREPGFYYVSVGFDWEVWQWTGREWFQPGEGLSTGDTVHVLGRVPDPEPVV